MFLIILLLIILLMHYVCVAWTSLNTPFLSFNTTAKILPIVLSVLFGFAFVMPHRIHNDFTYILQTIGHIWLGILFLYFSTVMLAMAVQLLLKLIGITPKFQLGPIAIAIVLFISTLSIITALRQPSITHTNIETDAPGTDGLKIVQVSDSHFGGSVTPARAKKLAIQVNALSPDIIVFTGDIFEDTGKHTDQFVQAVNTMQAKLGKYGVSGNHEYYRGINHNVELFKQAGIQPLQNQAMQVGPINIIGINDVPTTHITQNQFEDIIKQNINGNFNLLLSHTPLYFDQAAQNNVNLMLSGHTHNGQIWPFKYIAQLKFKHFSGLYKQNKANLYVSSGTFYWGPPLRFLTKNELPVLTLKQVQK